MTELVGTTDIAKRAGVSREAVRLWATGDRGPGDFPEPVGVIGGRTKVWSWPSVHRWLVRNKLVAP